MKSYRYFFLQSPFFVCGFVLVSSFAVISVFLLIFYFLRIYFDKSLILFTHSGRGFEIYSKNTNRKNVKASKFSFGWNNFDNSARFSLNRSDAKFCRINQMRVESSGNETGIILSVDRARDIWTAHRVWALYCCSHCWMLHMLSMRIQVFAASWLVLFSSIVKIWLLRSLIRNSKSIHRNLLSFASILIATSLHRKHWTKPHRESFHSLWLKRFRLQKTLIEFDWMLFSSLNTQRILVLETSNLFNVTLWVYEVVNNKCALWSAIRYLSCLRLMWVYNSTLR